jgi:hypothetical protein
MQANDTLVLVFAEALDPTSLPAGPTVKEDRSGGSTLTVPGLIQSASIDNSYLGANNSSGSATGTVTISADNKTVTVTVGTISTTGSGIRAGNAGTGTIVPATAVTDAAGNGATGSANVNRLF